MKARADADDDVFLPNAEPDGPVSYVLICMEPSFSWARSAEEGRRKVELGFRNFLASMEISILRFCARRYLCGPGERYHITDLSKGAMPVRGAGQERAPRYDRWLPLLEEEIELVATPTARMIAVGSLVAEHLARLGFRRPVTRVIHYSGQAARARIAGTVGREEAFQAFLGSVSLADVVAMAEDAFEASGVPEDMRDEELAKLRRSQLTRPVSSHLLLQGGIRADAK